MHNGNSELKLFQNIADFSCLLICQPCGCPRMFFACANYLPNAIFRASIFFAKEQFQGSLPPDLLYIM